MADASFATTLQRSISVGCAEPACTAGVRDRIAWARSYASGLEPASVSGGGYLNYSIDETNHRVRAAFGDERFSRLTALKARWDPDNRFRFNHNIPPPPP
jgi:FAD/FMN-containing dehydrogenase